ncbi:MAG: tRNA (adenosine(37)-N6)-threonylcarbamoyltransferase complex ATPase subunit type 1 TsaE [Gammaproteobacteria bacterium]|nr:tRNA (adenosine(37)-N6)-threonylcarbamoyltransferase complex ATPase subunit type 1 TsaE [Gammaproteobacteria bacterium]
MKTVLLKNSEETASFAAELAVSLHAPANIYLEGQLGAGKTTFVQGFLRGLGYEGLVKSPTYTLVETYSVNEAVILHADLYRIKDSLELEEMGFRDYFNANTIALIEWASHAKDWLPKPYILCTLKIPDGGVGRLITMDYL